MNMILQLTERFQPKEPALQGYLQLGSRYVSKKLFALFTLLLLVLIYLFFINTPTSLEQLLGRYSVLVQGTKQAESFSGKAMLYDATGALLYQGEMKKGVYEGTGVHFDPTGMRHEGQFAKGQLTTGQEFDAFDRLTYEGNFANGAYNGEGTLFDTTEKVKFKGQFVQGKLTGPGTEYFADGQLKYTGTFANGLYDGEGKLLDVKGQLVYTGSFAAGRYSGAGKLFGDKGTLVYEGGFKDGLYSGAGTEYHANGQLKYKGEFVAGLYHGAGTLANQEGKALYTGAFASGTYHGSGEQFDTVGNLLYKGQFVAGARSGVGEVYDLQTNVLYKGFFKGGLAHVASFIGMSGSQVEKMLGKSAEGDVIVIPGLPPEPTMMTYNDYQIAFLLNPSQAAEEINQSYVQMVQVWGTYGLSQVKMWIANYEKEKAKPGSGQGTPKGAAAATADTAQIVETKDGSIKVYGIDGYVVQAFYSKDGALIRAEISARGASGNGSK